MIRFTLFLLAALVLGTLAFADDAQAFGRNHGRAGCGAAAGCSGAYDGWYPGKHLFGFERRQARRAARQAARHGAYAAHGCSGTPAASCAGGHSSVAPPAVYGNADIERSYEEDSLDETLTYNPPSAADLAFSTARLDVFNVATAGTTNRSFGAYCKTQKKLVATAKVCPETMTLKWIEVKPDRRREGFATELYQGLVAQFGGPLAVSPTTPEGRAWAETLKTDCPPGTVCPAPQL